jgi:hypothetical protein
MKLVTPDGFYYLFIYYKCNFRILIFTSFIVLIIETEQMRSLQSIRYKK